MRALVLAAALVLLASSAYADDIGPVRPSAGAEPASAEATDPNVAAGWTQCLIRDGDDVTVPANRFDCKSITTPGEISPHTILVSNSDPPIVWVRAVTCNASDVCSNASADRKGVENVPWAPNISDSALDPGTEDLV